MKILVYDLTMTSAPECLLAPRRLMLRHLDDQPGDDLDPIEAGIVGDAAHVGEGDSYHLGSPEQNPRGGYSIMESSRDRYYLTGYACASDWGHFTITTRRGTFDLFHFSRWLVAECRAGAADTRDIREIIYSPDGKVVRRFDRLGRRTSGDSSHLFHTHVSYFRDAIKAGRDQTPVYRRYLEHIGAIPTEVDFMSDQATFTRYLLGALSGDDVDSVKVQKLLAAIPQRYEVKPGVSLYNAVFVQALPKLLAAVDEDKARDAELRDLVERHASGQLSADAVVDALAKRLQVTPGA